MSDLTTLTSALAAQKQAMVDRLVAQGDTTIQNNDPMATIVSHYETLRAINYETSTITENGSYVAPNGKTGYNNFVVNVPSGGPATHKKYSLLDRVYEDVNGDSIGTVVGFHYDANNVEYAIVALDAVYRLAQGQYLSSSIAVANLPNYNNGGVYGAKETATFNCDKILAQATTSGLTSTAVSHCRSQTFTIAGDSYAGQLPTLMELLKVLAFRTEVNTADPTATANPTLIVPNATAMSSSTQNSTYNGWITSTTGGTYYSSKNSNYFVLPILEIPNAA